MPISPNAKTRAAIIAIAGIFLFMLTASVTTGYAPADTDGPGANGRPGSAAVSLTPPSSNGSYTGVIVAGGRTDIPTPTANGAPSPARRALTGRTLPAALLPEPHFWFERPFTSDHRQWAESTFPYGSNGDGAYVLHTGIDITNPLGTPVRAIANGTVIYAGNDAAIPFGPQPHFYGNLVVVRLDRPRGEPVYALFGHLDKIHVSEGQRVRAGDALGTVGMTGIAIGPHLHLEVRQGNPGYTATRNPGLWLQALPGCGILAGVITDEAGRPVSGERLLVYRASRSYQVWRIVRSYLHDEAVHGDDALGENFLLGDLPAGEYEVVAGRVGGVVRVPVKIEPGQLTFVELKVAAGE